MNIAAGAVLGPYEILAPLGAGGMGEVYQAHDTRLDREVAIKVLPAEFAQDAGRLRRFEQEARATSALNHPNILTIYDIGAHEGSPYIVAELRDGEELRAQLEHGAIPARRALEYAQQITQGLAAAHEKGVVHRDPKPENLFVTKDGRVKILDFGLAKLRQPQPGAVETDAPTQKRLTDPGVVMGTVGYMSPEQVRGQETDHRSDIFAFGVILYEMLSGQRAFPGASAIEVMNAILKEEPTELGETNTKISPQLEKLVRRCLEKQPERRFHSAHDLGFALEAFIKYMAAVPGDTASGAGWLVFGRDDALLARPFDTSRLEFTGEPFSLSDKVGRDILSSNNSTFSVSDNGVLVFDPSLKRHRRQYIWKDRRGQQTSPLETPAGPGQPGLSPDGKRFIADRLDPQIRTADLWLYDVSGSNPAERFTFDPANDYSPVWAPNGSSIVWASNQSGVSNIYQRAASGAKEETLLLKSNHAIFPTDWSRDGRFIIYRRIDPKTQSDVWVLPMTGSGKEKPRPVVRSEAWETAGALSPDGRWLAYASDVSGLFEVYVQSFPDGGGKWQVSTGGGSHPRWRRDGRELFYYARDGKLMAAQVRSGESFEKVAVVSLFEFRAGSLTLILAPYAVMDDGQRFLINTVVETEANAPLTVVVNWPAEIKK